MPSTGLVTFRRICLAIASAVWSLACTGAGSAWAQPVVETLAATASSQWGAGYGADAAADGIANENGNYWQTVEKTDRGAWWQVDLGQAVPVRGVHIAWACYEDKYHAPPARVIVQLSDTGADGSWKDVLTIEADKIPVDEAPMESERSWDYPFPEPVPGRFVRLFFPDGDQPHAKYDGYICLGEVQVQCPGAEPKLVSIEARFGKVEVDVAHPALVGLHLRGPDGRLSVQPLLAQRPAVAYGYGEGSGTRRWARQGYTYVVGEDQVRYESRLAAPEHVDMRDEAGGSVLRITGVTLSAGTVDSAVASEDWTLSAPGDGSQLVWEIARTWKRDFNSVMSGSPGLFFAFDPRRSANAATSTVWYDPFRIAAGWSDLYAINVRLPGRVSENRVQTIRDRDTWAVYKLWTNWQAPADLRLEVEGGHLYRRGSFAYLSEAGAVSAPTATQSCTQGQVEHLTLKISAVDKLTTGYQLAITLPDKTTESSLKDFYGSVLNGGAVNDQKGFDFGNETDGWYYAGSCWMYGAALAAGTPAAGQLAAHPCSAAQAFREHLAHVLSTIDEHGRAHFGYNQGGEWVDDNLHTIIGMHFYLLHSGDVHFVRQCLPALERMLTYFVQRRGPQGLFKLDDTGAHWYYDCVPTSGTNGYYNTFFYKAAIDLAEMEHAAGREQQAREYAELAASIKAAFNRVFWKDDAAGGPRYIDWIDAQGKEVAYFCDLCQWPPIAVGIASGEQARKIVATADARITQLEQEYGYPGYAGLSALWPVPKDLNPPWQPFGIYMNGGSLLCQTYWEILARTRAGDAEGATRRLRLFAARAAETSWVGNNSADMLGTYGKNESGEAYLADMVVASAAVIHGVLGIAPTWDRLEVMPHLPVDWPRVEAEVLYKGRRHHMVIDNGTTHIEPLEQVLNPPLLWVMDFNLRRTAYASAHTANVVFHGHYGEQLALSEGATSGSYLSPAHDWGVPASLNELTVAVELNGVQASTSIETSDDEFATVTSQATMPMRDGVNSYALNDAHGRAVRVRFELLRPSASAASPVVDGFRVTADESTRNNSHQHE